MQFLYLVSAFAISAVVAFMPSSRSSLAFRTSSVLFSTASDGTVKWYNAERGFGFIEVVDGGPDMYVHATGLSCDGPLIEHERVRFATQMDSRTNKPKAINVVRNDISTSTDPVAPAINDKSELNEIERAHVATKAESFQQARLETQLKQAAHDAQLAGEKRIAEEAAAAAAAKAAAEIAARELGYPSVAIMNARQQPKTQDAEAALAAKYAVMNLEERAFTILVVSDISYRSNFLLFYLSLNNSHFAPR